VAGLCAGLDGYGGSAELPAAVETPRSQPEGVETLRSQPEAVEKLRSLSAAGRE